MEELAFILLLVNIGFIVGTIATIGGIGGGPLVMPIFLLIFEIEPEIAKGTSIFMIFLSSGIGAYTHYKAGKINIISLLLMAVIGTAGSFTYFLVYPFLNINIKIFYWIFGCFELFIAFRYGWKAIQIFNEKSKKNFQHKSNSNVLTKIKYKKKENTKNKGQDQSNISPDLCIDQNSIQENLNSKKELNILTSSLYRHRLKWAIPFFFLAGFVSSFLGIGGGPINVPVLYDILRFPIYNATAGSTTIIFFNSIINVILYGIRGEINWKIALSMGFGMMNGSFFGAKFAHKIPRSWTLLILTIIMVIAGGKMLFS
ncbi:sulfite exporter TauE/SafE family protein [Candidatus Harpocratesius sp.]